MNVVVADEQFTATGLLIYERNYLDVYIYEKWNAKEIHQYQIGNTFQPTELTMPEGTTSPPNLLTEADLIALMDKNGIGTDATHAEHINTIKERGKILNHSTKRANNLHMFVDFRLHRRNREWLFSTWNDWNGIGRRL